MTLAQYRQCEIKDKAPTGKLIGTMTVWKNCRVDWATHYSSFDSTVIEVIALEVLEKNKVIVVRPQWMVKAVHKNGNKPFWWKRKHDAAVKSTMSDNAARLHAACNGQRIIEGTGILLH